MIKNDAPNFGKMLSATGEIYSKTVSKELTKIYWIALKHYAFIDISRAINKHVANTDIGQYMPKPADIIRAIEGSNETLSMQAWSKVSAAISIVGPYQNLVFDDAIIHQVIEDMGGWIDLCSHNNKEMEFKANEFNKRYAGYRNNPKQSYQRLLKGILSTHNTANKMLQPPKIIFIGNQEHAEMVYKNGGSIDKQIGVLNSNIIELTNLKKVNQ